MEEFKIIDKELRVYCEEGLPHTFNRERMQWEDKYVRLASVHSPVAVFYTTNNEDVVGRKYARRCKGAKLLGSWERGNFIDDPYGKLVRVGSIPCEVWDFREVLGVEKDIEKCLDYEILEILKNVAKK